MASRSRGASDAKRFPTGLNSAPFEDPPVVISRPALFKAFGHPLRIAILRLLTEGPESPQTMVRPLGESVSQVSYHVGVLRDDCGLLETVDDRRQSRESQKFYRLNPSVQFESLKLDSLPPVIQDGVIALLLEEFVSLISDAIELGSIRADRSTLATRPALFDEEGMDRAHAVMRAADEELEVIASESRQRLRPNNFNGGVQAVLGLALFKAPPKGCRSREQMDRR